MSTATISRPRVKARNRKPAQPVHGTCRWIRRPQLPHGIGTLEINGVEYDLEAHTDGGRIVGFRLVKPDDTAYDLNASGEHFTCDCPDGTYQPNRPGGCKHVRACQVAGLLPAAPLAVLDRMRRPLPADGQNPAVSGDRGTAGQPARQPAFRSLGDQCRNAPELCEGGEEDWDRMALEAGY